MKKFTPLVIAALLAAGTATAQQDPRFTHYYYNQLFINPAYSGLEGVMRFNVLGRSQWLGYNSGGGNAPNTALVSFNTPLLRANSGIGGVFYYEQYGVTTQLHANVNYAYHIPVGAGKLSIGAALGVIAQSKDASKYNPNDINDPYIPGNSTGMNFDPGAGVYYRHPKFFVGLSAMHLTAPVLDVNGKIMSNGNVIDSKAQQSIARHYYAIAGYNFEINPSITLTPNVLWKSADFKSNASQLEGGVMATFNNKFWAGLNYSQQEAVSVLAGLSLLKDNSLRFGYSLDLVTNGQETKQSTSHELYLSYSIPVALKGPKPAVRTPRYRK